MKNRDFAIECSKFFEAKLGTKGAKGKGLHLKVSSLEAALTPTLVLGLRKIARIRNKQVHEPAAPDFNEEEFLSSALNLAFELGGLRDSPPQQKEGSGVLVSPIVDLNAKADLTGPLGGTTPPTPDIAEILRQEAQVHAGGNIEELIDASLTKAHSVYYPAYERWDGFIFLAKQPDTSTAERINLFALAVAAGADLNEMVELAKKMNLTGEVPIAHRNQDAQPCGAGDAAR